MKKIITPLGFNPSTKTLDFSNISGFVSTNLLVVINSTARLTILDPVNTGLGISSVTGTSVTLQFDTTNQHSTDTIIAFYDDNQSAATDSSLLAVGTTLNNIQSLLTTALPLPTGAAKDGTDANGITQPVGGVGIRGWLSGIYSKLSSPLTVSGTVISSDAGTPITGVFIPSGGVGITGWLSAIWSKLSSTLTVSWSNQSVSITSIPSIPTGSNLIGGVNLFNNGTTINSSNPLSVSGTFGATISSIYSASPPVLTDGQTTGLQVDANGNLRVAGTFSSSTSVIYNSTPPVLTNGQTSSLQGDTSGNLKVNLTANGSGYVLPVSWTGQSISVSNNSVGTTSFLANQATVGTSAILIVSARSGAIGTGRVAVTIYNFGSAVVYIGSTVSTTVSNGFPLQVGAGITINTTSSIYAISSSASQLIAILETF